MTFNIRTIMAAGLLFTAAATMAQPGPVKNAAKAVFTLTTFKADGQLLASSHGVFVDANGTALSDWSSFEGASNAVVIDASGKRFEVEYMIGANEIYDVAKFHVKGKTNGAPIAATGSPAGSNVYLVGYSVKKPEISTTQIDKVETFMDKYSYYIIKSVLPDNTQSCPLVNDAGQVIGFVQHSKYTTDNHATDANYINDMQVTGLSVNDPVLRRTDIPTQVPDDKEQARLALILSGQSTDSAKYAKTVDMFIEKFPDMNDGYAALAQRQVNANDFAAAARTMETAIKNVPNKDEAYYSYARLIYQKEVYKSGLPYPDWSLDKAYEMAQKAYDTSPQAIYKHQQAQITYTKEQYQEAYDQFMALTHSDILNPELFYEAAQCKKKLDGSHEEIIELLDSAISYFKKPYTSEAAPYFYARAGELAEKGEYRKAVADYNQYDTLMLGRHPADFYYVREQCEIKGRLFQQALIDIEIATRLAPAVSLYWAEKGSLLLRLKEPKLALDSAEKSIALEPEYSDAFLVKGLAQIQLGDKKAGLETLAKARDLGNEQAPALLEKYK